MAWLTNTKTGKPFNTDWLDAEDRKKYAQIEKNQAEAKKLNSEKTSTKSKTLSDEDKQSILKDSLKTTVRAKNSWDYKPDEKAVKSLIEAYSKDSYVKNTVLPAVEDKMKKLVKSGNYNERKVVAMLYNSMYSCESKNLIRSSDSGIDSGRSNNTRYWAASDLESSLYKKLFD